MKAVVVFALLLAGCQEAQKPVQKLSGVVLVHAYVSASGVPQIKMYQRQDMKQCRTEATQAFNKVKAGSARVWCVKLRGDTK